MKEEISDALAGTVVELRSTRARLSLEGLALGDAFGETFFVEEPEARVRAQQLRDGPWRWTDDTAMAVSVVETLLTYGTVNQQDLAQRFAARYAHEPARGYGPGTQQLLSELRAGASWQAASYGQFSSQGSYGNGAAMRASVLGAWFAENLNDVAEQARLSAQVTHSHREGTAGAIAVAIAAAFACVEDGLTGQDFITAVADCTPDSEVRTGLLHAAAMNTDTPIEQVVDALGNGSRVTAHDTVPLALWCAAHHLTDYQRALWLTVSALGDRDTTCAIAGGIVSCRVGYHGMPPAWLSRREDLPVLTPQPPDARPDSSRC
jgi:ADP-ribosylglycohydrolase